MFLTESEDICSSYWGGNSIPVHKVEDSLKQQSCTQNHTTEEVALFVLMLMELVQLDPSLVVMQLRAADCRWIREKSH